MGSNVSNRARTCTFALATLCVFPLASGAQQRRVDSAFLRRLAGEAVAAITPDLGTDSAGQAVLLRAGSIQVGLNDLTAALHTAAILARMPGSKTTFDKLSRETVCYLLEERDFPQARRAVANLARLDRETGEWTPAHFAVHLNRLPRPARKSLRTFPLDTAALTAESMTIAASLTDPAIAADTYISISSAVLRRDSITARRALRSADSARRLVTDQDFVESRQEMIAFEAFQQRNDSLASRLAATLSNPRDVHALANAMASVKRSPSAVDAEREVLVERIVKRSVELARHNPDRRVGNQIRHNLRTLMKYADRTALSNALVPEDSTGAATRADTADTLMAHAKAALQRGNMEDVERWVGRIPDPLHVGTRSVAWDQLANQTPGDIQLSRRLRQRAVDLLADERPRFAQRDHLLKYMALRLLMDGHNDEAVSIVNRIDDPKAARFAIRDIGESTLAHLDAPRLREIADELRSREVRDQVLFRLVISMLLVRRATPDQARWGLALVDSIRTRDLQLKARIESGKFLISKGDSAASRAALLAVMRSGFDELADYDRTTVLALLSSLNADVKLVKWARSRPPLKRAQALVAIVPFLQLKLPRSSDPRESWISNAPDPCREEF